MLLLVVNEPGTTEIYTLSLHDALPICGGRTHARRERRGAGTPVRRRHRAPARAHADGGAGARDARPRGRRRRSEEHTSELQSRLHLVCRLLLEKKNNAAEASTSRVDMP